MRLTSGTRVRRYEIDSLLGAGGMGDVYLARDVELGRTVALKVLPQTEGDDGDERIRRFLQEAKAAIALNHPNIAHIYDAGDENGIRFMAMEYVEGETLRERIKAQSLGTDEALEIATQIASALASAHAHGIVHRDVKPENVMLRPDGYVKVLDFGLAKLTGLTASDSTQPLRTDTGIVMGTVHYMSPEQLRAETVDASSDVFSLGVLTYELVSGRRPFESTSPSGVIAAILTDEPRPLENASAELNAVLAKALAKKREDRYATAGEMLAALRRLRGSGRIRSGDLQTQVLQTTAVRRGRMPRWALICIAIPPLVAILSMTVGRRVAQNRRVERARQAVPQLEKLAEDQKYFAAWDLAKSIEPLVDDSRLGRALEKVSTLMSVASEPPGAQVYLQRILPDGSTATSREWIGTTPFEKQPIAKGDYVLTIEKSGYAPFLRSIQTLPVRHAMGLLVPTPPPILKVTLLKKDAVPPGMAAIEGGPYRLTGWLRPSMEQVPLEPFFIDRHEVSNRDFERFLRDGGYRRRELWKHPFVKDGRTLSFDEAIALLVDTTGLAGPRSWANGSFPQGRENYPVTDVTWYEAAAFAEWAGKHLPSIFEWDKAARNGINSGLGRTYPWGTVTEADVTLRANFRQAGPMPVDSLPSGMSMWGVSHLAGNVLEWLLNRNADGYAVTGASYDDVAYTFGLVGSYPGFFSAPTLGFRCARGPEQGALVLATNRTEIPQYTPVSDAEFERIRRRYAYEKVNDAKVVERKETVDWIREKVTYTAGNGSVATLYLYLPKGLAPPYQAVHFIPAGDVALGFRPLSASIESGVTSLIRSGRALFGVVLAGYLERERKSPAPPQNTPEAVDEMVNQVIDLRRGLDYIASRPDIDAKKIGFYGPSAGADIGLVIAGLEDRYAAVTLSGAGIRAVDSRNFEARAEMTRLNFAARISAPALMLHGRYDESHPLKTEAEPLFALIPKPKELKVFEGGHIPSPQVLFPTLNAFFDKHMGPIGK